MRSNEIHQNRFYKKVDEMIRYSINEMAYYVDLRPSFKSLDRVIDEVRNYYLNHRKQYLRRDIKRAVGRNFKFALYKPENEPFIDELEQIRDLIEDEIYTIITGEK